jgi:hypothetical protein
MSEAQELREQLNKKLEGLKRILESRDTRPKEREAALLERMTAETILATLDGLDPAGAEAVGTVASETAEGRPAPERDWWNGFIILDPRMLKSDDVSLLEGISSEQWAVAADVLKRGCVLGLSGSESEVASLALECGRRFTELGVPVEGENDGNGMIYIRALAS